jgi:hypothetical protein
MEPLHVPQNVLRAILCLASSTFQDRYITGATADEYVTPENLLNDTLAVEHWIARAPTTSPVKAAIHGFLAVVHKHIDGIATEGDMLQDPGWIAIRSAAAKTLEELGHGPRLALMESGDFSAAISP